VLLTFFFIPGVFSEVYEKGIASWYGGEFHLQLTANGEIFDTYQISAAHQELPFGTIVQVRNLENEKTVDVRINDRGPFVEGRIIDLSYAAAEEIDMIRPGTAPVELRILYRPEIPEDHYHRLPETDTYRIQTAAFSSQERAETAQAQLQEKGYTADIEKGEDQLYRVFVRNIKRDRLEQTEEHLGTLGFSSVLIRAEQ